MRSDLHETRSSRFFDRLSRRAAVIGGAASVVALGTRPAMAQVASPSPEASPATGVPVSLLFVQSAAGATLTPGDGEAHTLTLTEVTAQTLYFSDRPNRIAGTTPTEQFVSVWEGEFHNSPPNGVLVGHLAEGEEAVVVELLDPVYDGVAGTLTYQVLVLDAERIGDRTFEQEPLTVLDAPREYTEAYLFIDDAWSCAMCLIALGPTAALGMGGRTMEDILANDPGALGYCLPSCTY